MSHNQTLIANAFLGWGATAWVYNGFRYYNVAGDACVRFSTEDSNTGSAPTGFDYGIFNRDNYGDTVEPDSSQGIPNENDQMSVTAVGWIWWGPRNRYYWKFRDGIGKGPEMICGTDTPESYSMFAYDPDDASSELALYPGSAP